MVTARNETRGKQGHEGRAATEEGREKKENETSRFSAVQKYILARVLLPFVARASDRSLPENSKRLYLRGIIKSACVQRKRDTHRERVRERVGENGQGTLPGMAKGQTQHCAHQRPNSREIYSSFGPTLGSAFAPFGVPLVFPSRFGLARSSLPGDSVPPVFSSRLFR